MQTGAAWTVRLKFNQVLIIQEYFHILKIAAKSSAEKYSNIIPLCYQAAIQELI